MSSSIVTCDCGANVRLPADRQNRAFRCPACKTGIALTVDSLVLKSTPLVAGDQEVVCPICQTEITAAEQVVTCPGCMQVHHSECWSEIGGCGTYGCQQAPAIDKSDTSAQAPLTAWGDTKSCPACGEEIKSIALRCRYCETDFGSVDPMSAADLRRQSLANDQLDSFRRTIVALFIVSLIGCAAPLMAIATMVVILPKRELLAKCGPLYAVLGYTALALSCLYSVLIVLFIATSGL
ncbi:MAG: hypothetical protein KDB00_18650 [Planctomycetales bacterium]|nr:hypothetical protein [Planctomycetales bacterium]